MKVTVVDRSELRALKKTRQVLCRYLDRVGSETYIGNISQDGLINLKKELLQTKAITKQASVSAYLHRNGLTPQLMWTLGSKAKVSAEGLYAYKTSNKRRDERVLGSAALEFMALAVRLAGLFHDLGKGTEGFNEKLKKAVANKLEFGGGQDPIRHELISVMLMDVEDPESFMNELSSQGTIGSAFEARRRWLASKETRIQLEKAMDKTLAIEGANAPTDFDLVFFMEHLSINNREKWEQNPFWMSVMWLVMTHHKLPGGAWNERRKHFTTLASRHLAVKRVDGGGVEIAHRNRLSKFLDMPVKDQPWMHREWARNVCRTIRSLKELRIKHPEFEQQMFSSEGLSLGFGAATPWLSTLTRVGRLCLVLGDYEASCDASKQECKINPDGKLIANTKQVDGRSVLADFLHVHLTKVGDHAPRILRQMFINRDMEFFRAVSINEYEKPLSLAVSMVVPDGQFAWQGVAQQHFARFQHSQEGIFCVVAAGTGKGKTRACAAMMTACRTNPRFSVLLSMRSLTFQTAKAYLAENVGFRPDQVAMLVGDDVLKKRFVDEKRAARKVLQETFNIGTDNVMDGREQFSILFDSDERAVIKLQSLQDDHLLMRLLSAPVSVMTIDHIISLVDLSRSKETLQFLHLMSTDLVIDEVDMYTEDDLICLGRLIEMSGQFGRRVIIASATLPRVVVEGLRDSYCKGYTTYQALYNAPDAKYLVVTHLKPYASTFSEGDFGEFYQNLMERFVAEEANLATEFSRRRVINAQALFDQMAKKDPRYQASKLVPRNCGGKRDDEEYYQKCLDVVRVANQRFAQVDPLTGLEYSIGFVRLNFVRSVQGIQKWLEDSDTCSKLATKGIVIKSICYHAQTLGVVRAVQEEFLEHHLNRTRMNSGAGDPLLESDDVRYSLDMAKKAGAKTVIFIVLTSPIIETGRDLDFDWCVLEPCSTTSIVQAGGRVRRHRTAKIDKANVFVMPLSIKAMTTSDDAWRNMNKSGYAPLQDPLGRHVSTMSELGASCAQALTHPPVTASRAFSRDLLRSDAGLHAGHCLLMPESYSQAPLTVMERVKQMGWLSIDHARMYRGNLQSHYTLEYARQCCDVLLSNVFYANNRFRGGQASERIEYLRATHSWCRLDAKDQVTDANDLVVCHFSRPGKQNSIHLLRSLSLRSIEELLDLSADTAQRMGFSERNIEKADSTLLGAQISAWGEIRSIRFDPHSGVSIHTN